MSKEYFELLFIIDKYLIKITYNNFNFEEYISNVVMPLLYTVYDEDFDGRSYRIYKRNIHFECNITDIRLVLHHNKFVKYGKGTRMIKDDIYDISICRKPTFQLERCQVTKHNDKNHCDREIITNQIQSYINKYIKSLLLEKINNDVYSIINNYID